MRYFLSYSTVRKHNETDTVQPLSQGLHISFMCVRKVTCVKVILDSKKYHKRAFETFFLSDIPLDGPVYCTCSVSGCALIGKQVELLRTLHKVGRSLRCGLP